ncbi:dsDNA nuclease domain-containing protein [Streptomyces lavendulae]|uniref:dsDNA nuclease domain-containing protein n=1 Tax=Streptomyces lavendulae TaxID=1914 RepID=UPI00368A0375
MSGSNISDLAKMLMTNPEEDSGSDTASRYNFQYQCAARHCFAMLEDAMLTSIVCEWHVDYVLIYADGVNELVSVKHREPSQGLWAFSDLWKKGGLDTLYARWKTNPESKCRLVTNGSLKAGSGEAAAFSAALSQQNFDTYLERVAQKLGCTARESERFLQKLRIEHGIPDRVTLRSHEIVTNVERALSRTKIDNITAAAAWDAVVNLVARKSRDYDNRAFSAIDLASPDALDAESLTSAKIARRTIKRSDVEEILTQGAVDTSTPFVSNLATREPVPNFIGRDSVLQEIEATLNENLRSIPAVILAGMSGIGKTELLSQFAWRFSDAYQFTWWIRADSWNSVLADLATLAEKLGLPAPDSDDGIARIKQYFRSNPGLILLDGAPAEQRIINLLPVASATHFLISSIDQSWASHIPLIKVPPLADQDAQSLLATILTDASSDELSVLSKALKGLPLALRQAAGYISMSGISAPIYAIMVRDRARELLTRSAPPQHIGLTAALSITVERLRRDHPAALELLGIISHVASSEFPTELFSLQLPPREGRNSPGRGRVSGSVEVEENAALELDQLSPSAARLIEMLMDTLQLFDASADLQKFSLVDLKQNGISCHALTQAVIRQSLSGPERTVAVEAGAVLLNKVARLSPYDSQNWPHYRHMMPHFEALIEHMEAGGMLPANVLMMHVAIAASLGVQGVRQASLTYAENAVRVADAHSATLDPNIGVFVRAVLIESLTGADRWDEALRLSEETLSNYSCGQLDALSMATLHTKKAAVLHLLGRLEEALLEFDKAQTWLESYGVPEESLEMESAIRANKATLRRETGDPRGAAKEFEQLIADYPQGAPRNGLATLWSNLSLAHLESLNFTAALESATQALEISHASFDGLHIDAARDWNNAGLALLELNRAQEAAAAFEASLRIHERLNEWESSARLIVQVNLGRSQLAQHDLAAACETLEVALREQEVIVGVSHREVAATLANLAVVYTARRRFGDAVAAANRGIKIDLAVYGEGHPELIPDYHNMASALMLAGSFRAALKWLLKAHEIAVESFGKDSLRSASCLSKIAVCEYSDGRVSIGVKLMREAVSVLSEKLGKDHPEVDSCIQVLNQMLSGAGVLPGFSGFDRA